MSLKIKSIMKTLGVTAFAALALFCSCDKKEPSTPSKKDQDKEKPTPVVESDVLSIMSFNMRYPSADDTGDKAWDVRKVACVAMFKDIKPDVVATQELRTAQRTYLKGELPEYTFIEIPNTGTSTGGNLVMLFRKDRFTKIDSGHFFLSATPDVPSKCWDVADNSMRGTVWVHLKENRSGKEFVCMGTHMPVRANTSIDNAPYNAARKLGAELMIQRLRAKAGNDMMCFLMGDMNCAWKDSKGNDYGDVREALTVMSQWMTDARTGKDLTLPGITSYNSFGSGSNTPNRNIDHIFFRNAEQIDFNTISKSYENIRCVSDHYPIMIRVKLQ